jgi:hypothetical protein
MTREQQYYHDMLAKAKARVFCADRVQGCLTFKGPTPDGLKDGEVYWNEVQLIVDELMQGAEAVARRAEAAYAHMPACPT